MASFERAESNQSNSAPPNSTIHCCAEQCIETKEEQNKKEYRIALVLIWSVQELNG